MGTKVGLKGCGKSRPHRGSIPEGPARTLSRPTRLFPLLSSRTRYTVMKPVDVHNLPICVHYVHEQQRQLNKYLLNMRKDSALTDGLSRSEHVKE